VTGRGRAVANFSVAGTFSLEQAVLTVRGELDDLTAPELGAFAEAAIASGYASVVFDMAELDFLNAAGLSLVVATAVRLAASGGQLTIRSPSALVRRLLRITGLAGLVRLEPHDPAAGRLGAEQSIDERDLARRRASFSPSRLPRRVAFMPGNEDLIDGALRLVVSLAQETVGGADGVSVSLRRHGRLSTVAASDQTILDMDADQYEAGEGPCVDASVKGRWFHAESLATETRWPAFTPRARMLGINAILSSPLLARERPVGALNIYSRTAAAFAPSDQERASVFASEASMILTTAGADVTDEQLSRRLNEALRTRQVIAQAEGVIMERRGVDEDSAYTALLHFSVNSRRPLKAQAEDVVASARQRGPGRGPGYAGGLYGVTPS
jgi:anti-anti-sigma factor